MDQHDEYPAWMISLFIMQGLVLLLTFAISVASAGFDVTMQDADSFFLPLLLFLMATAGLSWLCWTSDMKTLAKFFAYLPFLPLLGGLFLSMMWFG